GLGNKEKSDAARDRELALLEQAAESRPRDGEVQSYLALLYAKKKQREKALARVQTALALAPDDNVVLENIGEAYEDLGDRARALQYIQRSLQKGYSLAGHTDFKRTRSNFDSKRFACPTVHADVVIHSDVAHQGSLGVVRAGSEVVDVIEDRLFADGGLGEEDSVQCNRLQMRYHLAGRR